MYTHTGRERVAVNLTFLGVPLALGLYIIYTHTHRLRESGTESDSFRRASSARAIHHMYAHIHNIHTHTHDVYTHTQAEGEWQ